MRTTLKQRKEGQDLLLFDAAYTVALDQLASPIWLFDLDSYELIWGNESALTFWGAASLEEFRRRDATPQSPGVRQRLGVVRHDLLIHGVVEDAWTLYPCGQPVPLTCRLRGFRLNNGHVAMLVEAQTATIAQDKINDLRLMEVIRHTPMLVSLFQPDGRSIVNNPAAHAWLHEVGLDDDEEGDLFLAMFVDTKAAAALRRRALSAGFAEARLRVPGRGIRHHAVQLRRVLDPLTGKPALLAAQFDMTATMRLEARLEKALRKERAINENQRQFLSLATHEFRTPLSIIDAATRRLLRLGTSLSPAVSERVESIRSATTRMLAAIEKTLAASLVEEGKIAFQPEPTDIGPLIDQAVTTQQGLARDRTITLSREALPPLMLDRILAEQCIDNILSNAVKYSYPGSHIEVGAAVRGRHVVIRVRNEGIGIPAHDLPRIFDHYFRASNARGIKGTGIGLYTVHHFMTLHGGTITVRSSEQEWTEVELRFPIPAAT